MWLSRVSVQQFIYSIRQVDEVDRKGLEHLVQQDREVSTEVLQIAYAYVQLSGNARQGLCNA